ncbi:hypothetical protein Tco_1253857 [Tanacetum coccineum]
MMEDAIWGLETFSNSIHWWRKDEKVIPHGVSWSNRSKFEKLETTVHSHNVIVGGLDPSQWNGSASKSFVMDDPEFKATDNEEGSYSDTFLSTQQDVRISESIVVDHPSLDNVKTVVVPFQRQKYPGKACVSHYVPLSSMEFKARKRRHIIKF